MSLRSGAGLDGLQEDCTVGVFGELDWSPEQHRQCIGRLDRDGQTVTPRPVGQHPHFKIVAELAGSMGQHRRNNKVTDWSKFSVYPRLALVVAPLSQKGLIFYRLPLRIPPW